MVFDGGHEHLAHPLELRKIPLGQLNIFPEDNTDPNEPDEETNSEMSSVSLRSEMTHTSSDDVGSTVEENSENTSDFIIDPEFQNLLRPLTDEEYEQLEKNLIKDRFPVITVWREHNTIIDGHHSYAIALQHNIPYTVREIELESRSAVIQWMYDLQLGRRNLSSEEKSYYRAKQYELLKQERGGDRRSFQYREKNEKSNCHTVSLKPSESREKSNCHTVSLKSSDTNASQPTTTASTVAEKTGVTERTIHRDSKYAKAVDAIAQKMDCSPQKIINSSLSRKQVKEMVDLPVETIKQKLENPTFIEPRELPELKVGDVVRIKSDRKNKDFVGYNGTYAICDRVYESCADIRIWQKLIPHVHKQFLQPIEGETITLKVTLDKKWLKNLMLAYDSIEEAIVPF